MVLTIAVEKLIFIVPTKTKKLAWYFFPDISVKYTVLNPQFLAFLAITVQHTHTPSSTPFSNLAG